MTVVSKLKVISAVIVLAVCVAVLHPAAPSYAAPTVCPTGVDNAKNQGPDPDLICSNDANPGTPFNMEYVVSKDGFTDIRGSHFKIYAKSDTITVYIIGADLCGGDYNNTHDVLYSGSGSGSAGDPATSFTLYNNNGGTDVGQGNYYANCSGSPTPNIALKLTNGKQVPNTNLHYFDLDANVIGSWPPDSFVNGFRLRAVNGLQAYPAGTENGIWVSQDPQTDSSYFGIQVAQPGRSSSDPSKYVDFSVPFGPDCSVSSPVTKQITLYDDDNFSNPGVQRDPFVMRLMKRLRSGGPYSPVTFSQFTSSEGDSTKWGANIYGTSPYDDGTWWRVYSKESKQYIYADFTISPDYVYRLEVQRLDNNNTLQFQIPYASVWADETCPNETTVKPTVSLSPAGTVNLGQTVTASLGIDNSGSVNGSVKYTPTFWLEAQTGGGSATTYDPPADQLIKPGAYPKNDNLQGPVTVPPAGFTQSPTWDVVPQDAATYKAVCASMDLSAPDDGTTIGTPNPVSTCTLIGKHPNLQTQNGDIRTGGRFPSANNGPCTVTANNSTDYADNGDTLGSFSVIGHNFGGTSVVGSWAGQGIFSTGRVINFGSTGVAASTGDISKYLTFANMLYVPNNNDGYFYNAAGGAAPVGTVVTTSCFSNLLNGKYASGNTTTINGGATVHANVTTNGADTYDFTGDGGKLIIDGGQVPSATQRIINVTNSGTGNDNIVEIDGNITLAGGTYTKISDLPAFVLLSGGGKVDTRVLNSVTQLDGIYAVNGDFNTCDAFHWTTGANQLGSGPSCNNKLKINGTLMVGRQLYPYRTAGQDLVDDATPAELIDLRPDVLLGDYGRSIINGGLSTVYQKELSPRF